MQRWEPLADLRRLEDRLSRAWNRFPSLLSDSMEQWSVPLDIREKDGNLVVEASLPGMKAEDIDVEIEDDVLTIKAETRSEKEERKQGYFLKERSEGSFYRSVRLPGSVEGGKAQSTYKDGVLMVTMPKKEAKTSKKVTINVN